MNGGRLCLVDKWLRNTLGYICNICYRQCGSSCILQTALLGSGSLQTDWFFSQCQNACLFSQFTNCLGNLRTAWAVWHDPIISALMRQTHDGAVNPCNMVCLFKHERQHRKTVSLKNNMLDLSWPLTAKRIAPGTAGVAGALSPQLLASQRGRRPRNFDADMFWTYMLCQISIHDTLEKYYLTYATKRRRIA